jgi:predicted SAM-dependent methyltransferase
LPDWDDARTTDARNDPSMTATTLTFAPDTVVRFRSGRILVHTTASPLPAFETDHPMLVGWLCQFVRPTIPERALTVVPATDRVKAAEVLDYLQRSGALVPADARTEPANEQETDTRTRQHLQLLARSLYDLACDVRGLGPYAERMLARQTGLGLERRLLALLAAVDGLRSNLSALRATYVSEQLQALGVSPQARELRLHIGCGEGRPEGWVNIDVHPAPLAMNVLWGLPFAASSARYVFVSHLLEHLFHPADVRPFLAELFRVLAPGGIVRIVVPDIEQCIEAYQKRDRTFFESRRETWTWWPQNATPLEDFLAYAGAGPEPAHLFEAHKYGYDFETLARVLAAAGFSDVTRSSYMNSAHEALRVDDVSAVAKARYGERYYSLFVEARRPEQPSGQGDHPQTPNR